LVWGFIGGRNHGGLLGKIISISIDLIGLSTAVWLTNRSKSTEMRAFENEYFSSVREFSILVLNKEDFRFSLIEKDINESNNTTLGN